MIRKILEKLSPGYFLGRKMGFDHGFNTARMIYDEIVRGLILEIEKLNSEIILGEEEDAQR